MFKYIFLSFLLSLKLFSVNAQNNKSIDLAGKQFQQVDLIDNTDTFIKFISNTKAVYIIAGQLSISGRTFRDECPCSVVLSGNNISIDCSCLDKEVYPDPIRDKFVYDIKTNTLTSKIYKYRDGKYFSWKSL
jgi:hypothetical protein